MDTEATVVNDVGVGGPTVEEVILVVGAEWQLVCACCQACMVGGEEAEDEREISRRRLSGGIRCVYFRCRLASACSTFSYKFKERNDGQMRSLWHRRGSNGH